MPFQSKKFIALMICLLNVNCGGAGRGDADSLDSLNNDDSNCGYILDGGTQVRTRYQTSSVPEGQSCVSETQTRVCNNGAFSNWDGNFEHSSCYIDSSNTGVWTLESSNNSSFCADLTRFGLAINEDIIGQRCSPVGDTQSTYAPVPGEACDGYDVRIIVLTLECSPDDSQNNSTTTVYSTTTIEG